MNRKQKSKPAMKQEPVYNQMPNMLGILSASDRVVTGANAVLTSTLSSNFVTGNLSVGVTTEGLLNEVADLVDPAMEDVINAFSSSRGYTSTVTPSVIRGYMSQVMRAVESLLVLKRSQDAKELTDAQGSYIAPLFTTVPTDGRNFITGGGGVGGAEIAAAISTTQIGTGAIGNAAWGTTYLSELSKLYLPAKVFELLKSLYSVVYANPMSDSFDSYITFYPVNTIVGLSGVITPETAFANAISTIDSTLGTYPDLRTIIGLLGIDAQPVLNHDWTRDVKGQQLIVSNDPLLPTLFRNEFLAYAAFDEFDIPQELQDRVEVPFVPQSIEYREDQFQVGSDLLPYLGFFRTVGGNNGVSLLHASRMRSVGTIVHSAAIPAGYLSFNGAVTALSATGEARISALSDAIITGTVFFPKILSAQIVYEVNNNDADAFLVSAASSIAHNGLNCMFFAEADHDISNQIFITELYFGVDWRQNIIKLANGVTANIHIG